MMKLFHGSNVIVEKPRIINRLKTLDFGEGFYTSENEDQAREFTLKVVQRRNPPLQPIVNCYEFTMDFSRLSVLRFDVPDEKWLDFVVDRRKGIPSAEAYDIITGPVANDDVFGTITLYEAGQLDKQGAIQKFKVKLLRNQIMFCNQRVLDGLVFIKSYRVGETA